jgi:hypothetical protein
MQKLDGDHYDVRLTPEEKQLIRLWIDTAAVYAGTYAALGTGAIGDWSHAMPCLKPLLLYRPRDPQASDLWRLLDGHFETFREVYEERFQAKYGYWRPIVERSIAAFLKCGDLQEGFARVRCPDCKHEMFVAYSCKQRCTCAPPAIRNAPC